MTVFLIIFLFIFGTILGSFGWVIIERAKGWFARNEWNKVFGGRSYCPGCNEKLLTWWQLIPLVGRRLQRGKCYRCKLPIPARYCWIEIGMGVIFVITWLGVLGLSPNIEMISSIGWELIWWLLAMWLLTLILIHDIMTQELNLYARVMWLVVSIWLIFSMPQTVWLAGRGGSLVLTAVFGIIYLCAKRYATHKNDWEPAEWFGEWDVMVAMLIGLLSGPMIAQWWVVTSVQMMFVYLVGSSVLWIVFFLMTQKLLHIQERKIPFLPAMIVAWWLIAICYAVGVV